MKPKETVSTRLDDEELARIDKLAQERGLSRDAMLTVLVSRGLTLFETDTREAQPAPRPTDPMVEGWRPLPSMPSPWLGWLILVLVGVVVFLGGWALVRALDRRARPPVTPPAIISTPPASLSTPPSNSAAEPPPPAPLPAVSVTAAAAASTSAAAPPVPMRREAPARRARRPGMSDVRDPWGYD